MGNIVFHESYYQNILAPLLHSVKGYRLPSGKIIDLLSTEYAIEVDFTHKWAESIGQSLQYAEESGKKPCIVFLFNYSKDSNILLSITPLLKKLGIKVYKYDLFTSELTAII